MAHRVAMRAHPNHFRVLVATRDQHMSRTAAAFLWARIGSRWGKRQACIAAFGGGATCFLLSSFIPNGHPWILFVFMALLGTCFAGIGIQRLDIKACRDCRQAYCRTAHLVRWPRRGRYGYGDESLRVRSAHIDLGLFTIGGCPSIKGNPLSGPVQVPSAKENTAVHSGDGGASITTQGIEVRKS